MPRENTSKNEPNFSAPRSHRKCNINNRLRPISGRKKLASPATILTTFGPSCDAC